MRILLWPDTSEYEQIEEMDSLLAEPERFAQFLAVSDEGNAVGFAEASIRKDYVNGTDTSPVGYLEGIYVMPIARLQGVARELVASVVIWARSKGCTEIASDTAIENLVSQEAHKGLGFTETERIVFYRMHVPQKSDEAVERESQ